MQASKATSTSRTACKTSQNCRGRARWLGRSAGFQAEGKARHGAGRGEGRDLPQAQGVVPTRLARNDARAQQHRADRARSHRRRVQAQYTLNASVGHDQLPDSHAEALDEKRHVLVHLVGFREGAWHRVDEVGAVSGRWRALGRGLVSGIGAAYHTNGHKPIVVVCEAKRGYGGHRHTQWRTLLVDCCRKPARHRELFQQDQ